MGCKYFGKKIHYFERVGSTNAKTKEILKIQDMPEGSVVRSDEQFAGRGYSSNSWESMPGKNITVSFVLKPSFLRPDKQFWITKVISLGVKQTVEEILPKRTDIKIKWPNDIYVGDKKIAGILVENTIMTNSITRSIAGIGLNVNQEKFISEAPNPTSIYNENGKGYNLEKCLEMLCCNLELWYNKLRKEDYENLENNYINSLYKYNISSWFMSKGKKFSGTIKGIDYHGRLKVQVMAGNYIYFDFKEVEFLSHK